MDIVWKRYGYRMEVKNWYYFHRMDFEKISGELFLAMLIIYCIIPKMCELVFYRLYNHENYKVKKVHKTISMSHENNDKAVCG